MELNTTGSQMDNDVIAELRTLTKFPTPCAKYSFDAIFSRATIRESQHIILATATQYLGSLGLDLQNVSARLGNPGKPNPCQSTPALPPWCEFSAISK